MPRVYFTTSFTTPEVPIFPDEFAIITGYATTGETWPEERNLNANARLLAELELRDVWTHPITGHSPGLDHAEPGFATALGFNEACGLGLSFLQTAIFYVRGDELFVSYCDERRALVPIGAFRERLKRGSE